VVKIVLCLQEAVAHSGLKESRVRWLGDSDIIVTSGFNQVAKMNNDLLNIIHVTHQVRSAEMAVWDVRNLSRPVNLQSIGGNVG